MSRIRTGCHFLLIGMFAGAGVHAQYTVPEVQKHLQAELDRQNAAARAADEAERKRRADQKRRDDEHIQRLLKGAQALSDPRNHPESLVYLGQLNDFAQRGGEISHMPIFAPVERNISAAVHPTDPLQPHLSVVPTSLKRERGADEWSTEAEKWIDEWPGGNQFGRRDVIAESIRRTSARRVDLELRLRTEQRRNRELREGRAFLAENVEAGQQAARIGGIGGLASHTLSALGDAAISGLKSSPARATGEILGFAKSAAEAHALVMSEKPASGGLKAAKSAVEAIDLAAEADEIADALNARVAVHVEFDARLRPSSKSPGLARALSGISAIEKVSRGEAYDAALDGLQALDVPALKLPVEGAKLQRTLGRGVLAFAEMEELSMQLARPLQKQDELIAASDRRIEELQAELSEVLAELEWLKAQSSFGH